EVDFCYELTLGRTAERGIEGNEHDTVQIGGEDEHSCTDAGSSQRGLAARVSRANNDYVVIWFTIVRSKRHNDVKYRTVIEIGPMHPEPIGTSGHAILPGGSINLHMGSEREISWPITEHSRTPRS